MSRNKIKPIIFALSLVLVSSLFLNMSYSQGPKASSGSVNGTLEMGDNAGLKASSALGTSNITESETTTDSVYAAARNQFLKVWDTLRFHPIVATFVNGSAEIGNGVYQEHSNIFNPNETITLYAQPIGFGHKEVTGQNGERLFMMKFTADIILTTANGTVIGGGQNIPVGTLLSHYRNTELFLHLFLSHEKPLPTGEYKINYTITDEVSGNTFKITKDLKVV